MVSPVRVLNEQGCVWTPLSFSDQGWTPNRLLICSFFYSMENGNSLLIFWSPHRNQIFFDREVCGVRGWWMDSSCNEKCLYKWEKTWFIVNLTIEIWNIFTSNNKMFAVVVALTAKLKHPGFWCQFCDESLFFFKDGYLKNQKDSLIPHKGVSKNKGTPKWMVYNGKPY